MTGAERMRRHRKKVAARRQRRLVPATNDANCDIVATPAYLAQRIVRHFMPSGMALDPCRGEHRSFYDAMRALPGCRVDWCEITEGRDFFTCSKRVGWIVTNPPWSKMRQFLDHAMTLADDIVFLGALSAFLLRARLRAIDDAGFGLREALLLDHPPEPWPASGFQLAAVHIKRGYRGALALSK
jgi:hypothetical protein